MASIHEVAKEAGVSTATVSRTFSAPDVLSHQTRRRVLEAAERLDYRPRRRTARPAPDEAARAAVSQDCLGFLFFAPESDDSEINEFYTPVLSGAQSEAARLGMHLIVSTAPRRQLPREMPRMFREQAVAGMLLVGAAVPEVLEAYAAHPAPTVLVDNRDPCGRRDCVLSDNFGGGSTATRYLLGLGHRRIGFVMNEPTAPSFQDRLSGYQCAHREAGLAPDPRAIISASPTEPVEPLIEALLTGDGRPTALVAANDWNALVILKTCRALGLRVPDDLSLIGYDDMPASAHVYPPLTTLRVEKDYLGRLAVRRLHTRIQESQAGKTAPEAPVQIIAPVSLVVRESCRSLAERSSLQ